MVRLLQVFRILLFSLTLVSIPQWCDCCIVMLFSSPSSKPSFNPTMVRLLPSHWRPPRKTRKGFNPTMVRLLQSSRQRTNLQPSRFNPTMVRLLLFKNGAVPAVLMFQSHNGAIAARRVWNILSSCSVSIPQWCDCCLLLHLQHLLTRFVSIPQWCDCCFSSNLKALSQVTFQSHNGAIAAFTPFGFGKSVDAVSIPQWCDCCTYKERYAQLHPDVSIPQWCDCCWWRWREKSVKDNVSIPQWCDCCPLAWE